MLAQYEAISMSCIKIFIPIDRKQEREKKGKKRERETDRKIVRGIGRQEHSLKLPNEVNDISSKENCTIGKRVFISV